jgi:hypothetical protein
MKNFNTDADESYPARKPRRENTSGYINENTDYDVDSD